jgi:sugar transferase EpsL
MYKITKRALDFVVAIAALVILSPLLVIVAILVRRKLGSPILFKQVRPGLHAKPFTMLKFRTMIDAADEQGDPLPDDQRLTRFGKLLRSTSFDELPELWNIICGHMSLVGPRPLLMRYLDRYTPEQARRHEVRPGLTGWAQVNGRNAITWDERFALDLWYVSNLSTRQDLSILLSTFRSVWRRHGVTASGEATMPEFGLDHKDETSKQSVSSDAPGGLELQ